MGYMVSVNDPYKGVELVKAYSKPADRRHSLQLEINKRLYMDEAKRERNAGFVPLQRTLQNLIEAIVDYIGKEVATCLNRTSCQRESRTPCAGIIPSKCSRPTSRTTSKATPESTTFTCSTRAAPGPTVMVQALTHGNEFCGAHALDYLLREQIKPAAGKLVVAFANVDAYARFDFDDPDASRYIDEDYNRVWGDDVLFGARDSAELRRARQLQPFVDAADFLLDIHSMHEPCRPIMVCGMVDKHVDLARKVGLPADLLLDTGHPAGVRMRDRGSFNDPASPRAALLIECGQHWEKSAVDVAVDTMLRFLAATGSVPFDSIESRLKRQTAGAATGDSRHRARRCAVDEL